MKWVGKEPTHLLCPITFLFLNDPETDGSGFDVIVAALGDIYPDNADAEDDPARGTFGLKDVAFAVKACRTADLRFFLREGGIVWVCKIDLEVSEAEIKGLGCEVVKLDLIFGEGRAAVAETYVFV